MRIRSLVSSILNIIKHTEPRTTRYYSRLSKKGLPSPKRPASQAKNEAAPTTPKDTPAPSASRDRAALNRTFRKTHPVILRQIVSGAKDLKPQRSKPPRPTKPSRAPKRLSKPTKQAKEKAEPTFKASVTMSSASKPPEPQSTADLNHPSETTFTLTRIPLRAPFIRRHHSALKIQKITPPRDRRFQKIPSGPGIQHPATKPAEPEPEPIPKSKRKREHTFWKLDPFFSQSHPKHTFVPQFQRLTPSSTIRTHLITPDPRKITVNISYRPPQTSSDLDNTYPSTTSTAGTEAKEATMSDPTQNPSQLHGHATYVAGAAKEALGFASGAEDKEYAIKELRAAKEQAGMLSSLYSIRC